MEPFLVQIGVNRDVDTGGTVNNVDSQFVPSPSPPPPPPPPLESFYFSSAGVDGTGEQSGR